MSRLSGGRYASRHGLEDIEWPRLKAETPRHFLMLTQKALNDKYPGLDFKFNLSNGVVMKWKTEVRNSHGCPLDGIINFDTRNKPEGTPTSYPGFQQNIRVDHAWEKGKCHVEYPSSSDYLSTIVGLHTGSGGGGPSRKAPWRFSCSYDTYFFLQDFPLMMQNDQLWLVTEGLLRTYRYPNTEGYCKCCREVYNPNRNWKCENYDDGFHTREFHARVQEIYDYVWNKEIIMCELENDDKLRSSYPDDLTVLQNAITEAKLNKAVDYVQG